MATIKQKKAIKEITENNSSIRQAMKKAGYRDINRTSNLTKSKAFKELMEQMGITDEKLVTRLDEGLDATTKGLPDYAIRHKYIETSLKLKNHTQDNSGANFYQIIQEQKNQYGL